MTNFIENIYNSFKRDVDINHVDVVMLDDHFIVFMDKTRKEMITRVSTPSLVATYEKNSIDSFYQYMLDLIKNYLRLELESQNL